MSKGDKYNLSILEQEWDSLQVETDSFTEMFMQICSIVHCHSCGHTFVNLPCVSLRKCPTTV